MTDASFLRRRDLDELLLRRATEELNAEDAARLDSLIADFPDVDRHRYDEAVAAVLLSTLKRTEPLPAEIQERLAVSGRDWQRSRR